ncbi:snRNA-activating protein complex subunit, partial [Linum grandiflorum]
VQFSGRNPRFHLLIPSLPPVLLLPLRRRVSGARPPSPTLVLPIIWCSSLPLLPYESRRLSPSTATCSCPSSSDMDVEGAAESSYGSYGDEFAEEEDDNVEQADAPSLLIARGGPLYTPNLGLKDEVDFDSSEVCDQDDITVDDLRVLSNEELVEMALKEVLKDGGENGSSSHPSEPIQNERMGDDPSTSSKMQTCSKSFGRKSGASGASESHSETKSATNSNTRRGRKSRKKKRKGEEESYPPIVDELVGIKLKQDEDRRAATLHSLSAGCKVNKGSIASSESGKVIKSLRSVNTNMQFNAQPVKTFDIAQEVVPLQLPEVALVVEVYHNVHQWQKTQEFLVLGRQILTELKDKIYCRTDEIMKRAEHYNASGYFLIEDLFLNDMRETNATDYSEPIFDWLRNSKKEVDKKWEHIVSGDLKRKHKALVGAMPSPSLPTFQRDQMQTVRFCDLKFQLGAPYLYCHQGDCKHTIVIRDMRLIHPDDVQNRAAYPIESFRLKIRLEKCNACNIYRATKVTLDDKFAKHNPCYFCDTCYYLLHYKDSKVLYEDFSVYEYIHD